MTVDDLAVQALLEVQEHLDDADKRLPSYVREYAASYLKSTNGHVKPPSGMHPLIAKLARELVLDQFAGARGAVTA